MNASSSALGSSAVATNSTQPSSIPSESSASASSTAFTDSTASIRSRRTGIRISKRAVIKKECDLLYDPCTKEPLSNLEELEAIVRRLKQAKEMGQTGRYGLSNQTTNYEFLMNVFCNPDISLDDMVSFRLGSGGQIGSDIYEVLSRLFVLFGGIKTISMNDYHFMMKIENSASGFSDPIAALKAMKCKASSISGISDITLIKGKNTTASSSSISISPHCEVDCDRIPQTDVQTYVMSVKWYQREKSAEHYDLEKLTTYSQRMLEKERQPFGIIVFLKSKQEFQRAHRRAHRQYSQYLADSFFGWEEDVKPFLESIRHTLFETSSITNVSPQELIHAQLSMGKKNKPILSLQLHQDIIVESINDTMQLNKQNESEQKYVIGVLPRGGKTFIAGGIIREWMRRNNKQHVTIFWITGAPNETRTQVKDDLIEQFQDFDTFDFIEVKTTKDLSYTNESRSRFLFISIQLLFTTKSGRSITRDFLTQHLSGNSDIDLLFFDEAHAGGVGEQYRSALTSFMINYNNSIPLIFLTATYLSLIAEYKITKTNIFVWDYTDIIQTRAIGTDSEREEAIQNLEERFEKDRVKGLVKRVLTRRLSYHDSYTAMSMPYIEFPELFFISADFTEEAKNRFANQNVYNPNKGFDMGSIFGLIQNDIPMLTNEGKIRKDAYRAFDNIIHPRNLISILTPSNPDQVFLDTDEKGGEPLHVEKGEQDPSILKRIERISIRTQSRFRLDDHPTILMFLPTGGAGTNINRLLCAFASLLMNHTWWKDRYEVACIMSDKSNLSSKEGQGLDTVHLIIDHLKTSILRLERKLQCEKGKGLIILAGERLSMGISLPCTDVVCLFNDTRSPDRIIQKMYRALTPSTGKKSAFIVDLNPIRTLAATYGYTRASYESVNSASNLLNVIYDVYSWDADYMDEYLIAQGKNVNVISTMDRLKGMLELASKDPMYAVLSNVQDFKKRLIKNITQQVHITALLSDIISRVPSTDAIPIHYDESIPEFELKSGKLIRRIPTQSNPINDNTNEKEETYTEEVLIENFADTITDFIIYLSITTSGSTIEDSLNELESNAKNENTGTSLYDDVMEMMIARKHIDPIILENDRLRLIITTLIVETIKEYSFDTSRDIFRQMKGKIDEPSIRKNEVLKIIHRHLTPKQIQKKDFGAVFTPITMIEEMLDPLPKSDWSNPNLKWLDLANGIGNFPVVIFYRLDKGLASWEKNQNKRRKHIIENMLFMMELQSNNNRIAKNIFNKLCDTPCKPNIWTVNSLEKSSEEILQHFNIDHIDRIVGNPPFQAYQDADGGKRGGGDELYMKFTRKAIDLLSPNGYLVYVHPSSWRKPSFSDGRKVSKNAGMFELMTHQNQMHYLEIHDSKDGLREFKAATRYDFYVLQKKEASKPTIIKDQLGQITEINLKKYKFLPNFNINNVMKLVSVDENDTCELGKCILFERSAYGSDKSWVSEIKTDRFKYPLVHSTPKGGPRFMYSSHKDNGFFNIKKVIFGESGIYHPVIDLAGEYGMTQGTMAIAVKNKLEADELVAFLTSTFFKNILQACLWGNFRIDWRIFTYFKEKFWEIPYPKNDADLVVGESVAESDEKQDGGSSSKKRIRFTRKNHNK